jgi:endogenous inhibitor of DNA gyrase (YacG/DUF329 family)
MTTATKPCPICGKPRQAEHAPFCSARCRDRDLARWLSDAYAVPGPPAEQRDLARAHGGEQDEERAL